MLRPVVLYEDFRRPLNYRVLCSIQAKADLVHYSNNYYYYYHHNAITCPKKFICSKVEVVGRGTVTGSTGKKEKWEDLLILMNTTPKKLNFLGANRRTQKNSLQFFDWEFLVVT
jgi:hypothetical protein